MNSPLQVGAHVRVLIEDRKARIQPGDKGTVGRADQTLSGACYHIVTMDKDYPTGLPVVFTEGEIEMDV